MDVLKQISEVRHLFLEKKNKKQKKSCLWFGLRCTSVINQAWALVPERLPREAHQSFKHKSCT